MGIDKIYTILNLSLKADNDNISKFETSKRSSFLSPVTSILDFVLQG